MAKSFPTLLSDDDFDIVAEWRDTSVDECLVSPERLYECGKLSVTQYWVRVMKSTDSLRYQRYPKLSVLAQACLGLFHGTAAVERSFSESRQILTDFRKPMSLLYNALLRMRSIFRTVECHNLPLSSTLVQKEKTAHSSYEARVKSQKMNKAEAVKAQKRLRQLQESAQRFREQSKEQAKQSGLADALEREAQNKQEKTAELSEMEGRLAAGVRKGKSSVRLTQLAQRLSKRAISHRRKAAGKVLQSRLKSVSVLLTRDASSGSVIKKRRLE